MIKRIKKRHISIALFYVLLIILGVSILIDPVIPARAQDVIIGILVVFNIHFLNERNILFKKIKFFAEDLETLKKEEKKKEEFVTNIAHDLKTPAIAQIQAVKILLENKLGFLNDEQKSLLKETMSSCSYMSDLINTILYTYKYEHGKIKYNFENLNFKDIIREVCVGLSDLANGKEQNIILNTREDIEVSADRLQITRVVVNLISNALKHAPAGHDIFVSANKSGKNMFFEVKNECKNIKDDDLKKIFNKFSTSDKKSTGLGLYISKNIIKEHKGCIFVKNEGNMITFGFVLPLVKVEARVLS